MLRYYLQLGTHSNLSAVAVTVIAVTVIGAIAFIGATCKLRTDIANSLEETGVNPKTILWINGDGGESHFHCGGFHNERSRNFSMPLRLAD